jgi:hypothetical protein
MRPRAVFATAVGLVACPVVGWAAHGATLAIAPLEGSCETSGGIDDCVPGLSRYLCLGAAAAIVVLLAAAFGGRLAAPVAIFAAGLGSVIGDLQVTDGRRIWFGWLALVVGVLGTVGVVLEGRRAGRPGAADADDLDEPVI